MERVIAVLCLLVSLSATADASEQEKKGVNLALDKISKQIDRKITASNIQTTPIPGILEVTTDNNIIYVSKDGKYILSGELIDLSKDRKSWSMTEQSMRKVRKDLMATVAEKDMIVFPATGKKVGSIVVFTDIDCGYCRKMHEDLESYTDKGIEVKYVSFPRAGPGSESFEKAVSVWCSKDRQHEMNLAMQGKDIAKLTCKNSPIQAQYDLTLKLGISGTPTIILDNGAKVVGLKDPSDLLQAVKSAKTSQ